MSDTPTRIDASAPKATGSDRGRRLVRYGLMIVTAVVVIDAVVGEKGLLALLQAREQYRVLESSVQSLRIENVRLRDQARRLREDPVAVEEIARKDLGLIKPGEKLFILRDLPAPPPR